MLHATGCFVYCSNVMVENTKIDKTRKRWMALDGHCPLAFADRACANPSRACLARGVLGHAWPPSASFSCSCSSSVLGTPCPSRPTHPTPSTHPATTAWARCARAGGRRPSGDACFCFADMRQDEVCPLTLGRNAGPLSRPARHGRF